MSKVSAREFEESKRVSVAHLLIKAGRLVNERGLSRVPSQPGQPRLRPSHMAVLPHLDLSGTRMSTLAARMGITKQAVSQLVGDLEGMGVLRRERDPSDGRARLVVFAEHGPTLLMRGMKILHSVDAELETGLGARRFEMLRETLRALIEQLESVP